MNNTWAFLPMEDSSHLVGDPAALRARMGRDSYLLLRGVLDPDPLNRLRRRLIDVMANAGWVSKGPLGPAIAKPVREGDDEYFRAYDEVQKLEEFHGLAHDETLMHVMRQVLGETAFPQPLKIARLSFPSHYEVSTPPHQDYPNHQGTPTLTAAWIPVTDCPTSLGGLAVLRGSHRHGLLPLTTHPGPGKRQAILPLDLLEQHRWVTTDYEVGDVLLFQAMTVHASLHNASEFHMRLSVDYRYQRAGDALTGEALRPHFNRLSWDQVYDGWRSVRHQHYWNDLDYQVIPFDPELGGVQPKEMDADGMRDLLTYRLKRDARYDRQMAGLAQMDQDTELESGR